MPSTFELFEGETLGRDPTAGSNASDPRDAFRLIDPDFPFANPLGPSQESSSETTAPGSPDGTGHDGGSDSPPVGVPGTADIAAEVPTYWSPLQFAAESPLGAHAEAATEPAPIDGSVSQSATYLAADGGDGGVEWSAGSATQGTSTSSYALAGQNNIDSLAYGTKWGGTLGVGATLTYSFATSSSTYISGYPSGAPSDGLAELSTHQQQMAIAALNFWSSVADITFVAYNGGDGVESGSASVGDIRFAKSNVPSTAFAFLPTTHPAGGDVWIGPSSYYDDMSLGTYGFATILHELGHALGLTHTHEATGSSTVAASAIDYTGYSVMSYRSYVDAPLTGYTQNFFPTTPMVNDIAAMQYIYGANTSYNSGDTTYSWTNGEQIFEAIWDAGGNDTIDWSNQTSAAKIDLNDGNWSELGPAYNPSWSTTETRTMMIAYNADRQRGRQSAYRRCGRRYAHRRGGQRHVHLRCRIRRRYHHRLRCRRRHRRRDRCFGLERRHVVFVAVQDRRCR